MRSFHSFETQASLLQGLQNSADAEVFESSWRRFNDKYTPRMYAWARRMGLSQADAEEVCQDLMICLLRRMKHFVYDQKGSFRGWLHTVTKNAVIDFCEKQKKMRPTDGETLEAILDMKSLGAQLESLFDMEVLEEARRQVREELETTEAGRRNWEIFTRLELTDTSVTELAAHFNVKVQTVYVAKGRVLEALKEKVAWLNREED
jgi:RNA polymerase sigma-70 factor (ECF subfamily)